MTHSGPASSAKEDVQKRFRRNAFRRNLFLMALAALLLRLIVCWELGSAFGGVNNVFTPSASSDLATYMRLGKEIAAGDFHGPFYYQPFYYAVFLPILYLVSGSSIVFVAIVQAVFSAATVWLAGWLAFLIFHRRSAGYWAALLCGISTPLLLYIPYHQNETLQAFWLALLAYLALRACRKPSGFLWSMTGIVYGAAMLTRGNVLLLMPLLLFLTWYTGKKRGLPLRKKLLYAGVLLFFALLVQLPFICRNTRITGRLSGPSTAADAVLALGNTPEAPPGGRNPGLPAGAMYYPESYHRMMALSQKGTPIFRQMMQWALREPGAFWELQFRKLLLFWDYREIPNNVSLYTDGQLSAVIRLLLPGRSAVLLSLCAAGLLWFARRVWKRREPGFLLLYGFLLIYWGAVALFYILSRFRAPILPLAAVAGGGFLALLPAAFRGKKDHSRAILGAGGAVIGGSFLVCAANDLYRENCEAFLQRLVRPRGVMVDFGGPDRQYFDHGPYPFGAWKPVPLETGTVLKKEFCFAGGGEGIVQWSVAASAPGELMVRINGHVRSLTLEKANRILELRFPVRLQEKCLSLEVIYSTVPAVALFDAQRDYGRSFCNGERMAGEWVLRFIQPKQLQKP